MRADLRGRAPRAAGGDLPTVDRQQKVMHPDGQAGEFLGVRLAVEREDEDARRHLRPGSSLLAVGRGGVRHGAFLSIWLGPFVVLLGWLYVGEPGERLALLTALCGQLRDGGNEVIQGVIRYAYRLAPVSGFRHRYPLA
ncbi:hypothetical protein [Streptomyces platensis]